MPTMSRFMAGSVPVNAMVVVFWPFAAGYYLSYFYRYVNAVIAKDLVADFGIVPADLGLLTGAYFLSFALEQIPLGVALDRFGPRRCWPGGLGRADGIDQGVHAVVSARAAHVAQRLDDRHRQRRHPHRHRAGRGAARSPGLARAVPRLG